MKTLDFLKLLKKHPIFIENEVMINEAIKEIEDLETRSCNSCKSIKQDKDIPSLTYCSKGIAEYQSESYPSVGKDFYCNRWESRNESL